MRKYYEVKATITRACFEETNEISLTEDIGISLYLDFAFEREGKREKKTQSWSMVYGEGDDPIYTEFQKKQVFYLKQLLHVQKIAEFAGKDVVLLCDDSNTVYAVGNGECFILTDVIKTYLRHGAQYVFRPQEILNELEFIESLE